MRLFIGVGYHVSPAVRDLLAELEAESADSGLRVVAPENLHITLKFLGSVAPEQQTSVSEAMDRALNGCRAFDAWLQGIGCFARSIWLGLDDGGGLSRLAACLDESMAEAGFPVESRRFHPHLTVARLSPRARFRLSELQERHAHTDWGPISVDSVHLYRSRTLPQGPRYTIVHTTPLDPP